MARYGKKAQQKVRRAMRERKKGTLRSGRSGKKVTSRTQAIAIGLSEARREGAAEKARRSSVPSHSSPQRHRFTPHASAIAVARDFIGHDAAARRIAQV
jgi:hypothetical protein